MNKKDAWKGAAVGAGIGILAGAIAGILMAPKSGKETREDIKNYLHEMKDKIADNLSKAGDFTKDKYNEIVNQVVAGYETGKKITADEAAQIKEDLSSGYEEVRAAVKKAKEEK